MTVSAKHWGWQLLLCGWLPLASVAEEVDSVTDEEMDTVAAVADSARLYRNPEERRDAGLGTALTDWMTFSGLLEVEKEFSKSYLANHIERREHSKPSKDLQLALVISAGGWFEAEVIYEAAHERHFHDERDETFIGIDLDDFGAKVGRLYLPFGEYYSHLASGPALEFGETRANALIVDYDLGDGFEFSAFVFEGRLDRIGKRDEKDWGYLLQWQSDDESMRVGVSYLSDLAESQDPLLDKTTTTFLHRVPGWNAYLLWGFATFELTWETVRAGRPFDELERNVDQPRSQNLELAYFYRDDVQLALRIEHNRELEDEAQWRYGLGVAMRLAEPLLMSLDYLYNDYAERFVYDHNDNEYFYGHKMSVQLALEF